MVCWTCSFASGCMGPTARPKGPNVSPSALWWSRCHGVALPTASDIQINSQVCARMRGCRRARTPQSAAPCSQLGHACTKYCRCSRLGPRAQDAGLGAFLLAVGRVGKGVRAFSSLRLAAGRSITLTSTHLVKKSAHKLVQ